MNSMHSTSSIIGSPPDSVYCEKLVHTSVEILETALTKDPNRATVEITRQQAIVCLRALTALLDPQVVDMTSRVHGLPEDVKSYFLKEFVDEIGSLRRFQSIHSLPSPGPKEIKINSVDKLSLEDDDDLNLDIVEMELVFNKEDDTMLPVLHHRPGKLFNNSECEFKFTKSTVANDALSDLLCSTLDDWEFDIFLVAEVAKNHHAECLPAVAVAVFERQRFYDDLNIPCDSVVQYMSKLSKRYMENPYHNSIHGADVGQVMNHFIVRCGLALYTNPYTRFAAIFSSFVHDVGHPGVTNNFLIQTSHALAIRYNDRSPLEMMHASLAFELLHQPNCNLLANFSPNDAAQFRKSVISLVLATDNSEHNNTLVRLAKTVQNIVNYSADERIMISDQEQTSILEAGLHAADISSSGKPWQIYKQWTHRLCVEFRNQGDLEKARGLPVLPFMDRRANMPLSDFQSGFIDAIVLPLFESLSSVPDLQLSHCLQYLNSNLGKWKQLAQKESCPNTKKMNVDKAVAILKLKSSTGAKSAGKPCQPSLADIAADIPVEDAVVQLQKVYHRFASNED